MQTELLKAIVRASVPRPVRNWLRSPSKSVEWLWDSVRFSFGATKSLELSSGFSMVCHPHAHKVVYEAQIVDPEQREEFRHFVSHCTSKMFLYDIGAHFGVFSVVAAHFGGKAVAVDPSPTATRMIATEAFLNRCTDRIQILQAAVSDVNGALNMLSSGVYSAGYFKVAKGRSRKDLTQTQAFTIDQMVYHFGAPSHIKIDVEGHEAAVLRGATNTLTRYSPLLFLELHNEMVISEGGDPRFPLDELARLGYATFALNGESISREAILSRSIIRIKASKGKCLRDEE